MHFTKTLIAAAAAMLAAPLALAQVPAGVSCARKPLARGGP